MPATWNQHITMHQFIETCSFVHREEAPSTSMSTLPAPIFFSSPLYHSINVGTYQRGISNSSQLHLFPSSTTTPWAYRKNLTSSPLVSFDSFVSSFLFDANKSTPHRYQCLCQCLWLKITWNVIQCSVSFTLLNKESNQRRLLHLSSRSTSSVCDLVFCSVGLSKVWCSVRRWRD